MSYNCLIITSIELELLKPYDCMQTKILFSMINFRKGYLSCIAVIQILAEKKIMLMNERNIPVYNLSFYSRKRPTVCFSWETDVETYTQREDFFPYLLPGTRGFQRLHPLASSWETPLIGCVSLARLRFFVLCPNLTAWFSSRGLLPVTHLLYPTASIALPCLLITTWKLCQSTRGK